MRDEMDGRIWVENGAAFGEQMIGLLRGLGRSWGQLQAKKFAAPWRSSRSRCSLC